jgi:hypothetical protein
MPADDTSPARRRSAAVRTVNRVLRPIGLQLLRTGISVGTNQRRVKASLAVFDAMEHRIAGGPFAGTLLSPKFAWGDANVGAVVLGCYEEQLHDALEELITLAPDLVVNIGSAEGTYAVGLARRLPDSVVVAVDVEPAAAEAVRVNAALNGVSERVEMELGMSPAELDRRLAQAANPAVIIDCEGCEQAFVDPVAVPSLAGACVLIEVHEHLVPGIADVLRTRLQATHEIVEIEESGRNPHQYPSLRSMPSIDKWLVVCEGREDTMTWFWCRPRARSNGTGS